MATSRKPLSKTTTSKQQPDKAPTFEDKFGNVGENAAPDNPSHLMPGGIGQTYTTNEPTDQPAVDDLDPEELAARGYPNPEETPQESMSSTRETGTYMEQVGSRVQGAHEALTDKLDTIGVESKNAEAIKQSMEADEVSDYGALPGAPKDGIVLGPDEPLRVDGEHNGNYVVLKKAVYRAQRRFRTKRWSFSLLFHAGQQIPVSQLRAVEQPAGTEPSSTEETKDPSTPVEDKTGNGDQEVK